MNARISFLFAYTSFTYYQQIWLVNNKFTCICELMIIFFSLETFMGCEIYWNFVFWKMKRKRILTFLPKVICYNQTFIVVIAAGIYKFKIAYFNKIIKHKKNGIW